MMQQLIQYALVLLIGSMLTACGSRHASKATPPADVSPAVQKQEPAGTAPSARGGYYLDDGPGDNPPQDIDAMPDAVPRKEKLVERANKPYTALGQQYTPMKSYVPYKQTGVASWYGKRYHNNRTSSGEVYDMYGMTAAHTTLPIPSYVRVTNPQNGKSVVVKINDRGPFRGGRLIDLSYAAAYKLRLVEKGSGVVEVETINAEQTTPTQASRTAQAEARPISADSTQASPAAVASATFYVQTGAFRTEINAGNLVKRIEAEALNGDVAISSVLYNDGLYRVRIGPYASRQQAAAVATDIRRKLNLYTLVVNQ